MTKRGLADPPAALLAGREPALLGDSTRRAVLTKGCFSHSTHVVPGQPLPSVPLVLSGDSQGCHIPSLDFALTSACGLFLSLTTRRHSARRGGQEPARKKPP